MWERSKRVYGLKVEGVSRGEGKCEKSWGV